MKFIATLEVEDAKKEAFALFKDYEDSSDRSSIKMKHVKGKLVITLSAEDSTALRASFNSVSKLLTVYEKMSVVIKNGKRD
jgi:tRNA threonylcarbamoyladenosine modification (KEOPS) complex  Pcc1 subunit